MFNKKFSVSLGIHFKTALIPTVMLLTIFWLSSINTMNNVYQQLKYYGLGNGFMMSSYSTYMFYYLIPIVAFMITGNRTKHMKKFIALGLTRKDFFKSTLVFFALYSALIIAMVVACAEIEKAVYVSMGVKYFNEINIIGYITKYNFFIALLSFLEVSIFTLLGFLILMIIFKAATYFFDRYAWILGMFIWFLAPAGLILTFIMLSISGFWSAFEDVIIYVFDVVYPNPFGSFLEHFICLGCLVSIASVLAYLYSRFVKRARL